MTALAHLIPTFVEFEHTVVWIVLLLIVTVILSGVYGFFLALVAWALQARPWHRPKAQVIDFDARRRRQFDAMFRERRVR